MVRVHIGRPRLSQDDLCHLFALTPQGLSRIENGDDWRPEYSTRDEDRPAKSTDHRQEDKS